MGGLYGSARWLRLRGEILARDGWVCQLCHEPIDPDGGHGARGPCVDHIHPVLEGGDWYDPTNLRAAHIGCNTARGVLRRVARRGRGARSYPPRRRW